MSSGIRVDYCRQHTRIEHLFEEPFCKWRGLAKKVATVAFHILTLGIPLAAYKLYSYVCERIEISKVRDSLPELGIDSVQKSLPFPKEAEEAIQFARKALEENKGAKSFKFPRPLQPPKPMIPKLTTLFAEKEKRFFEAVEKNPNPWTTEKVLNAADELMKMSYAISVLTLVELDVFKAELGKMGKECTSARALTRQDSYQYRTFYYCTNVYHHARGELGSDLCYPRTVSKEHEEAFYKEGTIQNRWRVLYNDYCDRIRQYVPEEELKKADQRHVHWTQKDSGPASFKAKPDTQPS